MKTAASGDMVTIAYLIRRVDGQESGLDKTPRSLSFRIGAAKVLARLETGVLGMTVGERRTIAVSPGEGYGEYEKNLVLRVERAMFPPDLRLEVGRTVQYQNRDGERVNLVVNEVTEKTVTVDGNHPLAGLDLLYEVELLSIAD